MRKILFIILIILLLIASGFLIIKGYHIGSFEVLGVQAIKEEDNAINEKNSNLSNLVSVTYPNSLSELDTKAKTLTSTKQEYEDKSALVTDSGAYMQTEKYEIEFLWTKLGNYAKDENVVIKIDVVNSTTTSGLYDLNFTVAGEYADVTDFIYDIENDSKLGFKIEDFHMSANGSGVQGTFACKEIDINIESIDNSAPAIDENTTGTDNTTGNTTNTTTDDTTGNTTNTTDTTNATSNSTTTTDNTTQVAE